ncbi:MAG: hypothetical protein HQK88_06060 [Nitrospirae bacterium]|nr:hypothetical protein [Nitrospirota bacterium]MBF0534591.1 hypothetical protein [Nitrospirota bacterium]MBF0616365.1 hypothetical protein [Nitrospirota bacterium]
MKEIRRNHYFIEGSTIYSVEVVKRDSDSVSSFIRLPQTKSLVREFPDHDEALRYLFILVKKLDLEISFPAHSMAFQ